MNQSSVSASALEAAHPLTEAQSGLWYTQRIDPANPILNCGQYLDIRGPLDRAAFRAAFDQVMAESDAFTLRFEETADGPRQLFDENLRPRLEILDLSGAIDPEAAARAEIQADTATPVDLAHGPLAVFRLYRLGPEGFFFYERIHHLAIDGYAIVLVTNRVADLYSALVGGAPAGPPFPSVRVAFDDDRAYRASDKREADRAFWHAEMQGLPEIGGMAPGRPVSAHRFHRETLRFTDAQMRALRGIAEAAKVTWPDALTALASAYCRRFAAAPEIVIGVPHMGRLGNVAARVPCMLMNVLPLRVAPDEDQPLGEFLVGVSRALMRMRRHGRYRGEQLRRDLGLIGGARRLYGPLVNVQPFDMPPKMKGLDVALHILGAGSVDDITFTFRGDASAGLVFEVDSNPNLYSAADTRAHAERLLAFLDAAAGAASLADIPTASPREAERFIRGVNSTEHPVEDTTLVALIERTMRAAPDAPAIVFEGRTLSYADLDRASAALAAQLAGIGARPETIVAVALPRSLELVVALVAVLRAGAAYLPLDLDHPGERIRRILASAKPVVTLAAPDHGALFDGASPVLTTDDWKLDGPSPRDEGLARHLPPLLTPPHKGEGDSAAPATPSPVWGGVRGGGSEGNSPETSSQEPSAPLIEPPRPSDMAYVIYTSGSTGEPKGVVVEHRAIVNRLEWMRRHYGFSPADRILQKTPATFDVSVWEFFLPLITGATLVVAPPGAHRDPTAIAAIIRRERVTTCHFVPSMLSAFLAAPASRGLALARAFCSGEELTADQRDRFHRTVDAELHNLYGPTEAAVDVSFWPAAPDDRSSPVPIGFPVWNTRLYVLDERRRPVPAGVVGHLYLAGVQLARGYLGRPDLTAERFVADPFAPGELMYMTGDLARFRDNGAVVFLGRSDHQVKIRGLRIELGEIEAAIMTSGLVREACAVAREDRPGDRRIVAYVVADLGYDEAGLRGRLAGALPDYMMPSAFVRLDTLPVTTNGKLDRAALPAPELRPGTGRPPATGTERALSAMVAELLGLDEPPGADADFFALGGDSLSAVHLMLRFQERFGRDPGLGALFEQPTIAALAAAIDAEATAHDSGLGPVIRLAAGDDRNPPLFIVHPAGGISWGYRNLARALAPGRTVYGLQSPSLDPAHPLPESLEALAADYAARIVSVRPEGPYHLAGWSVGGIIAQAMAVRLRELGHSVGMVALLDSYPAECWRAEPEPDEIQALRALIAIAGYDPEKHRDLVTREAIVDFLRRGDSALGNLPDAALDGVIRVVLDTNRLVRGHHHRRYDGTLTHIRAALDHAGRGLVPDLWAPHAAALDRVAVPFLHPQLTGPDATALIAPELARRLAAFDHAMEPA